VDIYNHTTSTAPMGSTDDPAAVADEQGVVRSLAELRVVDASIFQDVPSAETNLTVIMACPAISGDIIRKARSDRTNRTESRPFRMTSGTGAGILGAGSDGGVAALPAGVAEAAERVARLAYGAGLGRAVEDHMAVGGVAVGGIDHDVGI
jgi:hypothetical protein